MALTYTHFINRPPVTTLVQLDASNRQELFDLIRSQFPNATEDGTTITWSHYFGGWSIQAGDWVRVDPSSGAVAGAFASNHVDTAYQHVDATTLEYQVQEPQP